MGGLHPAHGHLGVQVPGAQGRVVQVAAGDEGHVVVQAAIHDYHLLGRELGQAQGFIHQVLVGHRLAGAHARVGRDHHLGTRVVDAGGQGIGGEAAEHHRMDGADAYRGQHGEHGLRDHGHVDQHPVALAHSQAHQHGGHALHLPVQLGVAVGLLLPRLGGDVDQRRLGGALLEVAVHRVVAQVGLTVHEPLGEGRPGIVQHLAVGLVPLDHLGLLRPEGVPLLDRAPVELLILGSHATSSRC